MGIRMESKPAGKKADKDVTERTHAAIPEKRRADR